MQLKIELIANQSEIFVCGAEGETGCGPRPQIFGQRQVFSVVGYSFMRKIKQRRKKANFFENNGMHSGFGISFLVDTWGVMPSRHDFLT